MKADDQVILSGPGIKTGLQTVGEYEIQLEWEDGACTHWKAPPCHGARL
jgi:hypothetical protein